MSSAADLFTETFPVGPLACNCTIIVDRKSKEALLVDPGGNGDRILDRIKQLGVTLKKIIVTHAHFDHFLAAGMLKEATGAKVCINESDLPLWEALQTQVKLFGVRVDVDEPPKPDIFVKDEMEIDFGGRILHTPGHSMGSVCVLFEPLSLVCTGDTLFKGGIGRTDLFGGSFTELKSSICKKLYTLDDEIQVIPGHGSHTCIGDEKRRNPFVRSSMCTCDQDSKAKSKI